jgi:C4-dicarboxylate transporter, DctM subunit
VIGMLSGSLLGLLFLAVPVGFALGISTLLVILQQGTFPTEVIMQRAIAGVGSFPMLALPLFVLVGYLMEHGSTARLMKLANALLGRLPGGMAAAEVTASAMFGAVSGSGIAAIAAIGSVFGPELVRQRYPKGFIVSLIAAAGGLGVLIPPSVPLIIYGLIGNVSIGGLFFGTIVPGVLVTGLIILVAVLISWRYGFGERHEAGRGELWSSFVGAIPPLALPVVVLGGIFSGLFTATESAALGVLLAFILATAVYRELTWARFYDALVKTALMSAAILIILAMSASFAWLVTVSQFPQLVGEWLQGISSSALVTFAIIQVIILVLGIVLEALPIIVITTPIFLPVATAMGIDPIVYGIVLTLNCVIAGMSPPVAVSIYVSARLVNAKPAEANKWLVIFILPLVVCAIACMVFPDVVLALPRALGTI